MVLVLAQYARESSILLASKVGETKVISKDSQCEKERQVRFSSYLSLSSQKEKAQDVRLPRTASHASLPPLYLPGTFLEDRVWTQRI